MLDKKIWTKVFADQKEMDIARRKVISESSNAQLMAKQAIFALQRDNKKEAEEKLKLATAALVSLDQRFGKDAHTRMEGSWKASIEEYVESRLFYDFYCGKKISQIKEFRVDPDEYIGGLSDMTGEIVRMMVLWTTRGEIDKVKEASQVIAEVIHELMQNNFGGYLRTKFDQAKQNLRKSEEILYDLAIRNK